MKTYWMMRLLILCAFGLLAASAKADDMKATRVLTIGIVPQQTDDRLVRNWGAILRYLETRTGYQMAFRTAPSIPAFEQRLRDGEYDLAYMNPYHYTVFHEQSGYKAFVRARDMQIHGILVVPQDSLIQGIDELEGKALAFPSPAAFAASMLLRADLEQHGIRFSPSYISSHDAVYRAVADGIYPAGGGILRTFKSAGAGIREKLRILWSTPGYTPHALAAHPRVPADVVMAVQQALVAIHEQPNGMRLLSALQVKGFEVAEDSDWDDVRRLNLQAPLGLH